MKQTKERVVVIDPYWINRGVIILLSIIGIVLCIRFLCKQDNEIYTVDCTAYCTETGRMRFMDTSVSLPSYDNIFELEEYDNSKNRADNETVKVTVSYKIHSYCDDKVTKKEIVSVTKR